MNYIEIVFIKKTNDKVEYSFTEVSFALVTLEGGINLNLGIKVKSEGRFVSADKYHSNG